jgi:hypothetical protein
LKFLCLTIVAESEELLAVKRHAVFEVSLSHHCCRERRAAGSKETRSF